MSTPLEEEIGEERVFVCDDDDDVIFTAKLILEAEAGEFQSFPHPKPMLEAMRGDEIVLMDMNYTPGATGGEEGLHWLSEVVKEHPGVMVVLMTNHGDIELAVQAVHRGAYDFISKPLTKERVGASLHTALQLKRSRNQVKDLRNDRQRLLQVLRQPEETFIGESSVMEKVRRDIAKVAATDATVLILGENGTGKDLAAQAIHHASDRRGQPLVCVDMASLNEQIIESELFGHVKGAFTGADQGRIGRFEAAKGGTLFMDEIGNLGPGVQAKLLRALQDGAIVRTGSNESIDVDVRVISATNQPLYEMIETDAFREDFLFRLNTIEIHLPPLRERGGDVELLFQHFLQLYQAKHQKEFKAPSGKLLEHLLSYDWPGNIRELQHSVERAIILADGSRLGIEDFPLKSRGRKAVLGSAKKGRGLAELEQHSIEKALDDAKGNVSKAAEALGVSRFALYRKMKRHGIGR